MFLKIIKWVFFVMGVGVVLFFSSCGRDYNADNSPSKSSSLINGDPSTNASNLKLADAAMNNRYHHSKVCNGDTGGEQVQCHSRVVVDEAKKPIVHADPYVSLGYAPTQVRKAYGFDMYPGLGAGKTIGIVAAYNAPNIAKDLAKFKETYQITGCALTKVNQKGLKKYPRTDSGWALEISLDVQWACAIAPAANILLVEATSNKFSDMLTAVDYAAAHSDVVSMSWGSGEFSTESSLNYHFTTANVAFVAASGDNGNGLSWPALAPTVIGVGGTTLNVDGSGNYLSETAWSGSGGGASLFETQPAYQSNFPIPFTTTKRGSPDVAYAADPNTGVYVYMTNYYGSTGWFIVGGTSAGAPQWSALIAIASSGRSLGNLSTTSSQSPVYDAASSGVYSANYRDIISGTNGPCGALCTATTGYDFVTGLGSPIANILIPYLQTH
jgi:subtilase family serine protease